MGGDLWSATGGGTWVSVSSKDRGMGILVNGMVATYACDRPLRRQTGKVMPGPFPRVGAPVYGMNLTRRPSWVGILCGNGEGITQR